MDTPLWQTLTQWLHTLGLHLQAPAPAAAVPVAPIGADLPHLLALAAALGWASGFRLYAGVFVTGMLVGAAFAHNFSLASSGKGVGAFGIPAVIIGIIFCLAVGAMFQNKME